MQRVVLGMIVGVLVSGPVTLPDLARAQNDHLKCYKIKDSLKLKGIVDLTTPQFPPELGCKIRKAKLFCVPADKTVVQVFSGKTAITPLPVAGQDLIDDALCYKIKCDKPFPAAPNVTDQFGNRTLLKELKPTMLCTPTVKGDPPSPPPPPAPDDHLKCYKIKDPLKLKGIVDLDTPQFGLEAGCKIGKAKMFCAPATKTVQQVEVGGADVVLLPVSGQTLLDDRICYKIKCPDPFPPDQQVSDQFGTRTIGKLKPTLLCTPASKGAPTTTTTRPQTTTTSTTTTMETTTTTTMPMKPPCEATGAPQCDGLCPPGSGICTGNPDGTCRCQIFTPTNPPCDPTGGPFPAPQCWGECPNPMEVCVDAGGFCECQD